jgi:hypothetical protein
MRVAEVTKIRTNTVESWAADRRIDRVDHLKLDVQGAELAVLEGCTDLLHTVRSIKLEVQFNRLYHGVPLFGQVDNFLRERDFVLWRLGELSHCGFACSSVATEVPEIMDYDSRRVEALGGGGQLLWANGYYVRAATAEPSHPIAWDDALRDACLAHAHGYSDLAELGLRRSMATAPTEAQGILHTALTSS